MLVVTHVVHWLFQLLRSLSELDSLRLNVEAGEKIRQVTERATLFRITSNAMINVGTPPPPQPPAAVVLQMFCVFPGLQRLPRPGAGSQQAMAEGAAGGAGAEGAAGGGLGAAS